MVSTDTSDFKAAYPIHTAPVNGLRIAYRLAGRGDLVVLLHGFPETSYSWRKVLPALADHYTVLAPDLRGLGDSEKTATGYDKRTVAEDIYQLVRSVGFERFRLVGQDFGGSVAYALAAAYPQAVQQLVTVECMPAGLLSGEETRQLVEPKFGNRGWFQSFHLTPELPEQLVTGRERIYLSWLYDQFSINKQALTPADIDEYVRCYAAPGGMQTGFAYYRSTVADILVNQQSAQHKLAMPVLALGGDGSFGEATFKALQAAASTVQGAVLANCGHYVAEEQPQELINRLMAFFTEVQSR